jgi:hypothetical protein
MSKRPIGFLVPSFTLFLGSVAAAPATADVLATLTACQAERQTIADLPATLMRTGWSGVPLPLDNDRMNRLIMASLINVPAAGALRPESQTADWQIVWTEARNWVESQVMPFVQGAPEYAFLLEDGQGDLLYIQAGETEAEISISCTMAITATAAADPAFVPSLAANTSEGSVLSLSDRVENRFSRATHILIELAIRPQDFITAIGANSDVVAVLYTNSTYPKEAQ